MKRFLTYHVKDDSDPRVTRSADTVFEDGVEVEMPPERDWLWWKLQMNPYFTSRVEEDPPPEPNAPSSEEMQ